jgi:phage gpG-like protein
MPSFKNAIHNKTGLTIDVRFDLKPLIEKLERSPNDFLFDNDLEPHLFKAVSKAAKDKIKSGKAGRALKPSTIEIRAKRGHLPGPPLLASGKLFKSIEGRTDGLYAVDYAEHHLEGYTVKKKSSEFTKFWKKDHRVPRRNFLPTRQTLDIGKKAEEILVKKINRLIKRR